MRKVLAVLALFAGLVALHPPAVQAVPYQTEWTRTFGVTGHKCTFGFDIHNAASTGYPQAGAEIVSCPTGWHGAIQYIVVSTTGTGSGGWERDLTPPTEGYTTVGTMIHATDTNPPNPTANYGYYAIAAVNNANGCAYWGAVDGAVGDGNPTGQEVFGGYYAGVRSIDPCPS